MSKGNCYEKEGVSSTVLFYNLFSQNSNQYRLPDYYGRPQNLSQALR